MTGDSRRAARNAGFVACLLGALVMLAGRFAAGAPGWAVWVGLAVIAVGWALFIYATLRRVRPGGSHPGPNSKGANG